MDKRYTVGFLFTPDFRRVLLIHKLTPEWQRGRVNALGGKYEGDETPQQCTAREIQEECGIDIASEHWRHLGLMHSNEWSVDILAAIHTGPESDAESLEAQQVEWFDVHALPETAISNLTWLIPLCIDALKKGDVKFVDAAYLK